MAIANITVGVKQQNRCIMCEGSLEKANYGSICNSCKDKMRKLH